MLIHMMSCTHTYEVYYPTLSYYIDFMCFVQHIPETSHGNLFLFGKTYGSWCHRSATLLWPPWNWKQKWRRLKKQHLGIDRISGKVGGIKTKRNGFFSQVLKIIFFNGSIPGNIMVIWCEESYIWSCAFELVWIWHRLYIFGHSIIYIIWYNDIVADMLPHVPPSRCMDLIVARCRHWFPWCEGVSKSSKDDTELGIWYIMKL